MASTTSSQPLASSQSLASSQHLASSQSLPSSQLLENNMNNYLYLHPNENLAISLVSPVLDAMNYHS